MQLKDEIDFKEILKNPVRLFGLSYFYFLALGGFLGVYYLWNMNDISRNTITPVVLKDSIQFAQEIPMKRGAMIPPVNILDVSKPAKELIAKGENLFRANCASCHGDNGMGDGMSAAALKVKPRNFHSPEGWKNGRKISNIYRTLQSGFLESGMPAFNYTPPEDLFAIIHYIRTFATDFPVDSTAELLDLEKQFNLSKGVQLPAQIPIKMAMQKVELEHAGEVKAVNEISVTLAGKKPEDLGAKIAESVSKNKSEIAAVALSMQGRSLDEFIKIVTNDPVTIGFKPEVFRLSNEEWSALYNYLLKVNKEKKS